jgi:Type II secretion system (T2SS), protein E, N-terminal domain
MMKYKYLPARGALNEGETGPPPVVKGGFLGWSVLPAALEMIPESVARENRVLPLQIDGETITLAAADAENIALADKLRFLLNRNVRLVPAPPAALTAAINHYYGQTETESVDSMLQEFTDSAAECDLALGEAAAPPPAQGKSDLLQYRRPQAGSQIADLKSRVTNRRRDGLDYGPYFGGSGVFFAVVDEGQRMLMRRPDGRMEVIVGPKRVWRGRNRFQRMDHHVAHPGEFLIVRYRDGRQEHLPGPADVWFDPRVHQEITREDALQLAAKEAVVVYRKLEDSAAIARRIEYGPGLFVPRPGEWLHTFSWHASVGGHKGVQKVPNALVFQKLWLLPDQMYHDVTDVRTADDALLTIRLMIFFELVDIERMLDTTHDPIGDFVNAATSDVVEFTGRYDFETFKRNTDKLNELETYRQLTGRAAQCGYRINKVVYRGYGAPETLQQMHDRAIEARTKLQLDRATEQQAQDLENYKLDAQIARAGKRRVEQAGEVAHDLEIARQRQEAELRQREAQHVALREQRRLEAEQQHDLRQRQNAQQREHLAALRDLGVDLTAYLTQARADRVIELRGGAGAHVHLDPEGKERASDGKG